MKDVDLTATPMVKKEEDLVEIWPLHLLNLDDDEHFDLAFQLLHRVPAVVHHYLTGGCLLLCLLPLFLLTFCIQRTCFQRSCVIKV